jgi:hypothetical protein
MIRAIIVEGEQAMAEPFSMAGLTAALTAIKNASPTAVLIGSGLILFLPANVIGEIGLTEFRVDYRTYLGLALIASACLLVVQLVFGIAPMIGDKIKVWQGDRATRNFLKTLTKDEKAFLRPYVIDDQNTRNESIYNGIANGLEVKGLIYKASSVTIPGRPGMLVPFNMQPYVRKWLSKHRNYLS